MSTPATQQLTHFLALPIHLPPAHPPLHTTLHATLSPLNLPPSSLRPPQTLHITLAVLSLPTPSSINHALSILSSLDLNLHLPEGGEGEEGGLTIDLRGVSTFGNAARASMLFFKPEESGVGEGVLRKVVEVVRRGFIDAGLLVDHGEVKLHVTFVNTVYARKGGRHGRGKKVVFDARSVVEEWRGRAVVAGVKVGRVELCKMGRKEGEEWSAGYEVVGFKEIGE